MPTHTFRKRLTAQTHTAPRQKEWLRKSGNNSVMQASTPVGPRYFTFAKCFACSIFCLCILFTWTLCFSVAGFFRGCMFLASSALSDSSGGGGGEAPFVLRAFVRLLHFLYVRHGRARNEHGGSWLKIHTFTEQFIIPSLSPVPSWLRGHGGVR